MKLVTSILVLLVCTRTTAEPTFSMDIGPLARIEGINHVVDAFHFAMNELRGLPPETDNPFESNSRRIVHFYLTTSRDPVTETVISRYEESFGHNTSDAFTFTGRHMVFPFPVYTQISLLIDRLCFDPETGNLRKDAYVRILAALAHEIYGNLPSQLNLPENELRTPDSEETKIQDEIRAFKAGVDFLKRYLASEQIKGLVRGTRKYAKEALKREQEGLASWQKCGPKITGQRTKRK